MEYIPILYINQQIYGDDDSHQLSFEDDGGMWVSRPTAIKKSAE
jgi:hypothetical protein